MTGLRSSVQNCSEAIVTFHIEYSLAISQESAVFMLSVVAVCSGKISAKANDGSINQIFRACWHYILVLKVLA